MRNFFIALATSLVAFIIYLFAIHYFATHFYHETIGKNVTQTGSLGDTIGGLMSPFIGILTIIFVWLSYREQLEVNRMSINNTNYQIVKESVDDLLRRHPEDFDLRGFEIFQQIYIGWTVESDIATELGAEARLEFPTPTSIVSFHGIFREVVQRVINDLTFALRISENLRSLEVNQLQRSTLENKIDEYINSMTLFFLFENLSRGRQFNREAYLNVSPGDGLAEFQTIFNSEWPREVLEREDTIINLLTQLRQRPRE